jgi:hypothetical protein
MFMSTLSSVILSLAKDLSTVTANTSHLSPLTLSSDSYAFIQSHRRLDLSALSRDKESNTSLLA